MLRAQLKALDADLPPAAIKTGMLGSAESCRIIADFLAAAPSPRPLVCDPILRSTSGTDLLDPEARDILIRRIVPHVTVLTPNLPEAAALTGSPVQSPEDAAGRLLPAVRLYWFAWVGFDPETRVFTATD